MKKFQTICFIVILLTGLTTGINAQQQFGQLVINAGVGESPEFNGSIGTIFSPGKMFPIKAYDNAPYLSDDDPPMYNASSIIPNIGVTADYGILNWFSIGVAGSYQSEVVTWTPDDYSYSGWVGQSFPYTDKVSRTNIAARFLFHLTKNKQFDLYTGFRAGVSFWHDVSYSPDTINSINLWYLKPTAYFIGKSNLAVASFQYLWGMRFYFSDRFSNLGLHFEFGFGSPFLAEGGLTFRINTKKEKPISDKGIKPTTN